MTLIHKSISPFGDWIIFMNGKMLYKKWPTGRSLVFEAYGPPTSNHDRDNGTTLTEETISMADTVDDDMLTPSELHAKRFDGLSDETGSDGKPSDKAKALFNSVVDALAWSSGEDAIELGVGTIRDRLDLKRLIDLADPGKHPTMPMEVRAVVRGYMLSLPGFCEWTGYKQTDETFSAHAVIEAQLTAYMRSIADVYALLFDGAPMPGAVHFPDNGSGNMAANPFQFSSEALANMVEPLLADICDGAELVARAKRLFTVASDALHWLRDQNLVDFNLAELRDHFNLKTLIDLSDPAKFPAMPVEIRSPIRQYLESIPGFRPEMGRKQPQVTFDWHGESEIDLTKLLASLSEKYDYLFEGSLLKKAASSEDIPDDIMAAASSLDYLRGGPTSTDIAHAILAERKRCEAEIKRLRKAADYISPYLRWTIGDESPGHHPTMPSAVAAFHVAFDIDTQEKRMARLRASLKKG